MPDDSNHVVNVRYHKDGYFITRPVYQYDYGQELLLEDFPSLPPAFEMHFASKGDVKSVTQIGSDRIVSIPDQLLTKSVTVSCWLFLHDDISDGETRYSIEIPVIARAEITDQEPTPEEQSTITQAIAALDNAVERCQNAVDEFHSIEAGIEELPEGSNPTVIYDDGYLLFGFPPGPQGPKGDKGDTGEKGDKGDKGDRGATGLKGEKGDKGDRGEKGDKGDRGATGATGPQGPKGAKGDTGPQGEKGEKGNRGATGATGPKGDKGDKGDAGPQGPKGDRGYTGSKGEKGDIGPKGDKGDKGNTGATGPQGPKGDTGEKGDIGPVGPQGPKGDPGSSSINDSAGIGYTDAVWSANKLTVEFGKYAVVNGSAAAGSAKTKNFSYRDGNVTVNVSQSASGIGAFAEGYSTNAEGKASHAEGMRTLARGENSHAEGEGTRAIGYNQHVQGRYNIDDDRGLYADIVGNGEDSEHKSNAYTLDWDGNGYFAGNVRSGTVQNPSNVENPNDLTTKKYVDSISGDILKVGYSGNDLVAVSNIAKDEFFIFNNQIFKANEDISSGSTIDVGNNCAKIGLAEILNLPRSSTAVLG